MTFPNLSPRVLSPAVALVCVLAFDRQHATAASAAVAAEADGALAVVSAAPQESAAERVLFLIRAQRAAGHGVDPDLAEALREPAGDAPETVVATLLDGCLPPERPGDPPVPINVYQRELALRALGGVAPGRVRPLLPTARELRLDEHRLAAGLQVIAWALPPSEVTSLLDLSRPAPEGEDQEVPLRSSFLRRELRSALARMVAREPAVASLLFRPLVEGNEGERAAILGALGDTGDPRVLPVLLDALETRGLERAPVLDQVARLGRTFDRELDGRTIERVRELLHVPDERTVSAACRALIALDDAQSVPALVERLRWSDASGDALHAALRELTSARIPADPDAWQRYLESELAWSRGPLNDVLRRIEAADAPELVGLVRAAAPHRLQRDELAEALARRLDDGYRPVRHAAAAALAQVGSPLAVEPLVEALEREPGDPSLTAALTRLTGLTLGPDPSAWRDWLSGRQP